MSKKDLRQMKNEKLSKDDILKAARKANIKSDMSGVGNKDIKDVQDTISQYENKSENELMCDLEKAIRDGRKDGTFNDEMLDSFAKNVSPMMDSAQRKKLESLMKMIKSNKM